MPAVALRASAAVASDPAPPPDLVVRGLAKGFGPGTKVLAGVELSVGRGEAVALIGANGTGKSTLLRCCVRLIEPDAGELRLLGRDIHALGRRDLRRLRSRVGFVFQRHNLVPRLSALTNVLHGAQSRHRGPGAWLQSLAPQRLRAEALSCLDQVGLAEIADRRADQLSGGQSQRVAIARALMQRPAMLLADEPVASLDPAAGEEVMQLLRTLVDAAGLTLIFTAHNLRHALDYADRVLGLRDGRIAIEAPARALDLATLRAFYE